MNHEANETTRIFVCMWCHKHFCRIRSTLCKFAFKQIISEEMTKRLLDTKPSLNANNFNQIIVPQLNYIRFIFAFNQFDFDRLPSICHSLWRVQQLVHLMRVLWVDNIFRKIFAWNPHFHPRISFSKCQRCGQIAKVSKKNISQICVQYTEVFSGKYFN